MYTCCPQCQSVFRVSAHQISSAYGHVRCGCCGEVFNCVDDLADELDEDGDLPPCFHSDRPPTLMAPDDDGDDRTEDLFLSRPPPAIDLEPEPPELVSLDEDETAMAVLHPPERRQGNGGWAVGAVLLALAALAQSAWIHREDLARNPGLRPWLEQGCRYLGCEVPLARDLSRIHLVSRDIRPHPSVDDALIISATMQNRANFRQPHPVVEITLSNLSGQRIAMRRFQPAEYLEDTVQLEHGIAPGTLLPLVFEVVDPGQNAVAFEFSFR